MMPQLMRLAAVAGLVASVCLGVAFSQPLPVSNLEFGTLPPWYSYGGGVNISEGSTNNLIYQTFQYYVTPSPPPKSPPAAASAGDLSVNNPTCGDGSKHFAFPLTVDNIKKRSSKNTVFVVETHEIMPIMLVTLVKGKKQGTVGVRGPGMLAEVNVDPDNIVRTVCGNWVHSPSGYYEFEMLEVKDATVRILYYTRKYDPAADLVDFAFPIDLELDMNTLAAVDNHDIEVYVGVTADWATRTISIDVEQFVADRASYLQALDYSLSGGYAASLEQADLYESNDGNESVDPLESAAPVESGDPYGSYGEYDDWFENTYGENIGDRLDAAYGI